MNRRSFIKLAAAAMATVCVPMGGLPIVAPAKVIAKIGPFSAAELLGQWLVEQIEKDMIEALCGL